MRPATLQWAITLVGYSNIGEGRRKNNAPDCLTFYPKMLNPPTHQYIIQFQIFQKKKFRSNRACSVLISVGISLLHTAGSNQAPRVPCWGSSRDNRRRVGLIYIHFILSDWKENCPLILDVVILNRLCTVRCSTGTFWNFTEYHLNRPVGLLIGKSCFLCMGSWNLPVLGSSIHLVVPSVIIYII